MKLGTPRLGAAATIVNGQLLVVGGADTGAGAEVSIAAGTGFTALPFPADARLGAAVVAQDANTAMLAGGRDPATDEISGFRTMDLACAEDCTQVEIAKADFAFDYPQLFSLGAGQLLAVGEDPVSEETHVFTFDTGIGHALNEFALRVPRTRRPPSCCRMVKSACSEGNRSKTRARPPVWSCSSRSHDSLGGARSQRL